MHELVRKNGSCEQPAKPVAITLADQKKKTQNKNKNESGYSDQK